MSKGKVILIGAGCGDRGLITLRGAERLKSCSCVVYDALIDPTLLDLAPESAEKICVGKRSGRHSESQENINRLLIEKAAQGHTVARLKGGDPFVFGRGGEEILALKNAGLEYEVVPGISSSIAVPELAGIPVTHRRTARSFHVITGHTGDGLSADDTEKYAKLDGTLIFLMGLGRLSDIADSLIHGGKSPDTPSAVISNGASDRQKTVRAPLSEIAAEIRKHGLEAPAVIVVGETAAFDFTSNVSAPLGGFTVGVTGTKRFADKLSSELEKLGANVRRADFLKVNEYEENPRFDKALSEIERYGWIVLTSINGAEIFFSRMKRLNIDIRRMAKLKFAAIGSGTADAVLKHGICADLIPESYTSADLGKALCRSAKTNERILILRAENGSAELSEILDSNNIQYDDIKTYSLSDSGEKTSSTDDCDQIVFASASGVNAFFGRGLEIPGTCTAVCIGDITAKALSAHGVQTFRIAKTQNVRGIIEEILREAKR